MQRAAVEQRSKEKAEMKQEKQSTKKTMPTWGWGAVGLVVIYGLYFLLGGGGAAADSISVTPTVALGIGSTKANGKDGADMVYVPEGEFEIGSEGKESDESPVHTVYLDAYWMYKYEVTNAKFAQFALDTGYVTDAEKTGESYVYQDGSWDLISGAYWNAPEGPGSAYEGREDHPVIHVSWNDADAYCVWAGGRLPTEAEWEKAARGSDRRIYPWGAGIDDTFANYAMNVEDTTPVGSYPEGASPFGALDMVGNVWEWVWDWYDSEYYGKSRQENPTGPEDGTARVLRGGGWNYPAAEVRSSYRNDYFPDGTYGSIGFRCAVSAQP